MFSNLDWPKDVPKELCWEVMEQIHRQQIREIKAAKAYHQGMEKLKSGYRDALHELIGSDKLKRYKRLHKARIYKLRKAAKQLADTPEKLQQREALRLRLVNESKKTIEKSGVDTAKITALRTSYDKKVSGLFARTVGKGKMGEVIEEGKMPPKKFLEKNPDKKLTEDQTKLLLEWTKTESERLMQGN